MPLDFEAFPGVAGDALRTQRGAHAVFATGALVVLAVMIPQFAAGTRAADRARVFSRYVRFYGWALRSFASDPISQRLCDFSSILYTSHASGRP